MDNAAVQEIFAGLGEVTIKRLFSGKGLYHHGLIVGAVMDGEVLLKADAASEPSFQSAGAIQWIYQYPDGRTIKMPYWTLPADALDDADQLAAWVKLAYAAAIRAPKQRPKSKPGKRSS